MEHLTTEQAAKLDALIAELETLPTPEAIAESGRLRCPLPLDDTGKKRMRLVMAGGIAAEKLLAYITALDDVDGHRRNVGQEIFRLRQNAARLRAMQSLDAAGPMVMASQLSGRQEVDFHFFAVCVGRIERFLPIAAKAAGHKIPTTDRTLLASFRPLRDYYEHLEDRLPGGTRYVEAEAEEEVDGQWQVRMGLILDEQERVVLGSIAADVTSRGVVAVRAVLKTHWNELKPSALELVRKHFTANPTNIPDSEEVRHDLPFSSGRVRDHESI